jgi:hypothetical protein
MLVVHTLALVGFGFGLVLGATPWFTASVTLTGLLTGLGVPLAVLWLCVRLLRERHIPVAVPPWPRTTLAGPPWPRAALPPAALAGPPPVASTPAGLTAAPAGSGGPAWPLAADPWATPGGAAPLAATRALPTEALR